MKDKKIYSFYRFNEYEKKAISKKYHKSIVEDKKKSLDHKINQIEVLKMQIERQQAEINRQRKLLDEIMVGLKKELAMHITENNKAQLKLSSNSSKMIRNKINQKSLIHKTVSAGTWHTVALKSNGTAVAVGDNSKGQCNVFNWTNLIAVSVGESHTVGLRSNGTVVAVGSNVSAQCNVFNWKDIVAISAGKNHTVGLRSNGTVVVTGDYSYGQCNTLNWRDIVAVSAGENHTVGLRKDGTVMAVGDNSSGQCNVKGLNNILAISAGENDTVVLRSDGIVMGIGKTQFLSRRGTYTADEQSWKDIVAVSVGRSHILGLRSGGEIAFINYDKWNNFDLKNWENIVCVSSGLEHIVGLKSDGTVVATGKNLCGQCDVKDWNDIMVYEG